MVTAWLIYITFFYRCMDFSLYIFSVNTLTDFETQPLKHYQYYLIFWKSPDFSCLKGNTMLNGHLNYPPADLLFLIFTFRTTPCNYARNSKKQYREALHPLIHWCLRPCWWPRHFKSSYQYCRSRKNSRRTGITPVNQIFYQALLMTAAF